MKRLLITTLLLLLAPASAHAAIAPSLSIDTAFAPQTGIAADNFAPDFAGEAPADVAVAGDRIYTVGWGLVGSEQRMVVIARFKNGTYDRAFSGDGIWAEALGAAGQPDNARAIVALPDGRLRIAGDVDQDAGTSTNADVAVVGLNPDGSFDTSFGGGDGIEIFPVGAGDDSARRMAIDVHGRILLAGSTETSNVADTFVAMRNPDGSAAAFGNAGVWTIARSPLGLADEAMGVAFRPGGGIAVLIQVTTPTGGSTGGAGGEAYVRGLTDGGVDDPTFGNGGEVVLPMADGPTISTAMIAHGGRLWITGNTHVGVDQDGFVARLDANGTGLQSRRFDMRGTYTGSDAVATSGGGLAFVTGPPETLVVTGNSTIGTQGNQFAAAAFYNPEGNLAASPYGDFVMTGSSQVSLAAAAAEGPGSVIAAGLQINQNNNLDQSFATLRLLLDADKQCDLAIDVPAPLELTFVGRKGTAAQISVENKGERPCGGNVTINAPYKLGRAISTGVVEPGAKFVANAVPVTTSTIRKDDDVARFSVSAPGDGDASNDVRGVRTVFSFCDLALRAAERPATIPNEGGRRVEVSLRNAGTRTCRAVKFRVANGAGAGTTKPYAIERGRSVSDDVNVSAKSTAKVGKKATVRVTTASSDEDVVASNDSIRLTARVVGVGDTRVRSASSTRIAGSATAGKGGKADRKGVRLTRVEVAIRKLGSGCRWLTGRKFTNRKTSTCTPTGWKRAAGTRSWSLRLAKLRPGRYEVYTRAVTANHFREGRFSKKDGNRRAFRVR